MSGREASKLLNAIERAKKQKYNARLLRAFKRMRYSRGQDLLKAAGERGSQQSKALYGDNYFSATQEQKVNRLLSGFRGQGGYFMQKLFGAKKGGWLDRLGDVVTDTVLPIIPGGAIAQKAINVGGSLASRVFPVSGAGAYYGSGAYEPAASNALMHIGADTSGASVVPSVTSTGSSDGAIVVRHKEYVTDVVAQQLGFNNKAIVINPGLETSFPWLSQVAANFTEYTLHQCVYTFKSAIAPIGASLTGQVGSMIQAAQYNVSDEPFTSKQAMLLEAGSCADMITRDMVFGIECDPAKLSGAPGKYVRSGPVLVGADPSTYDHAIFNYCTDGIPAGYLNQQVGELWVEYTVELRKPRLYTAAGNSISRDIWLQPAPTAGSLANNWCVPFHGPNMYSLLHAQQNSIGTTLSNTLLAGNVLVFPPSYAGTVKVKVRLTADTTLAAGWGSLRAWAATEPSGAAGVDGAPLGTSNAISLIADIPGVFSTQPFVSSYSSIQRNALDLVIMEFEFHVRVDLPKPGIDNAIQINTPVAGATPAGNLCNLAMLEIEEYNTTFNQRQDGTNDDLVLVNQTGAVQVFSP